MLPCRERIGALLKMFVCSHGYSDVALFGAEYTLRFLPSIGREWWVEIGMGSEQWLEWWCGMEMVPTVLVWEILQPSCHLSETVSLERMLGEPADGGKYSCRHCQSLDAAKPDPLLRFPSCQALMGSHFCSR